jgi:Protein of unknown function (DUF3575)
MKKNILLIAAVISFSALKAQSEIKINPIYTIFLGPEVAAEFGITKRISIEPAIFLILYPLKTDPNGFTTNTDSRLAKGFQANLNAKYYIKPSKGLDRYYVGIYTRGGHEEFDVINPTDTYTLDHMSLGFSFGYKWVFNNNFILALDSGFGRKLVRNYSNLTYGKTDPNYIAVDLDGFFRFSIGYRFGKK